MGCYDAKVAAIAATIVKIQAHPRMTDALKAKRIQRLAADSVDQRSRYHAAAFNAANTNARDANVARAEELLAIAARDPALANPVAKLRDEMKAVSTRDRTQTRRCDGSVNAFARHLPK